ncbi:4Fe-4S dicluster domain-containing protein [Desulfobaculum bizertense]|uniref:Ferredoxin-type protein NapG n=1 Tax=Desulfobaculum bizertense DSM 18034 TaxID=1121442 RepID=A0A1T4VRA5_9BACT|nr:4Fe-4S dicluster domain-containing protein [Desulfobaculum bizertense]SKA67477.1 ferredoxin-type protein NapG [Desulfobaculum bizertense DSM 18034]
MPQESKKKTALSRRSFLKFSAEATVAFGVVGGLSFASTERSYIRPPGAISAKEFSERCMRCGACAEVCPTRAITLLDLTTDIKNMGTPVVDYHLGGCTAWRGECMRCIDVCPTKALSPKAPLERKMGTAQIRTNECVNCMVCYRWCPIEGAVLFPNPNGGAPFVREKDIPEKIKVKNSPYKPWIDTEKCVGCGLCAHYCIAECIDMEALKEENAHAHR